MQIIWPEHLESIIAHKDYERLAQYYEKNIVDSPQRGHDYWQLGLAYLLLNREEEAQSVWLHPFIEAEFNDTEYLSIELTQFLCSALTEPRIDLDPQKCWLIREFLRELAPDNIDNLLHFVLLSLELNPWSPDEFASWNLIEQIYTSQRSPVENFNPSPDQQSLLLLITEKILTWPEPNAIISEWIDACFQINLSPGSLAHKIWIAATNASYFEKLPKLAIHLAELGLRHLPDHLDLLNVLTSFYLIEARYDDAISTAHRYRQYAYTPELRLLGSSLIVNSFLSGGNLATQAQKEFTQHEQQIRELVAADSSEIDINLATVLSSCLIHFAYYRDRSPTDYQLHNQFIKLCQKNICLRSQKAYERYQYSHIHRLKSITQSQPTEKLRIGYLTKSFRQHSVGWLTRWLFRYHQRENFEIFIYFVHFATDEFTDTYFKPHVDHLYSFGFEPPANVAEQIFKDKIDILVDIDSITSPQAVNILSLRPAPVQVTWLGWDAMGLPNIDYFLADSYVLPEDAQDYYQEQIWRLPRTYVAVDGFEVGVPSLRREHLNIPIDSVIYLSAQSGCKRHPDQIRLQMRILRGVPNSYFLIKGWANESVVQQLFAEFAEAEGVDPKRIHFLPQDIDELTHRANLQIADVVLDTFPYNGATTTLEVLWLGIPLVTRVGKQFAARNSYGFLSNAGIQAGIAWSDDEYVAWGIRFGQDQQLREQVSIQLRQSRQTSPLWNAKEFTVTLEETYKQIWQLKVKSSITS